jgi:hypothetical protein
LAGNKKVAEAQPDRRIGRSIAALLAGFALVVILSISIDVALRVIGIFPAFNTPMSDSLFLLATAYRTLIGVAGSYLTARLAPNRPMQHALLGGAIGLLLSIIGAVTTWNRGPDFGPHWYPLALVMLAMPTAWVGGKLVTKRQ